MKILLEQKKKKKFQYHCEQNKFYKIKKEVT